MYKLFSPMQNDVVSQHNTLEAAEVAAKKFQATGKRNTFKPWQIRDAEDNIIQSYGMFEASGYSH